MEKKKNLFERLKQIREDIPTNSMASGKIAGSAEAGDQPPVRRKRKKYIYQKGLRKIWKPENGRSS